MQPFPWVTDDPEIMKLLMQKLLTVRVRPYYMFQSGPVKSTGHFKTSTERGLEIIHALRSSSSGLCVPHFVADMPHTDGKLALLPEKRVKVKGLRSKG